MAEGDDKVAQLAQALTNLTVEERARLIAMHPGQDEDDMDEIFGGDHVPDRNDRQFRERQTVVVDERTKIGRLKLFSGRKPLPQNEVDFSTWRLLVLQYLTDPKVRDQELKAAMLHSLSSQALDMVQPYIIDSKSSAGDMFLFLEDCFGNRKDGRELLVSFYNELQESGQLASSYLQTLYVKLSEVAYQGGIHAEEFDSFINEQFFRGCRDDALLDRLMGDPDYRRYGFPELVRKIRREESRLEDRKKRFGSTGTTSTVSAQVNVQPTVVGGNRSQQSGQPSQGNQSSQPSQGQGNPSSDNQSLRFGLKRRRKFCFRCGEDGHVANGCNKDHNPQVVQDKLLRVYEAQRQHRPN